MSTPPRVSKLVVEWGMLLPSLSNARFAHWSQRARLMKSQRQATALALAQAGVRWRLEPLVSGGHLIVWLERQAPRRLDDDNLRGSLKGPRDQVAAFFDIDDGSPLVSWCYRQSKGPATVRIELKVLTADAVKLIREQLGENAREVQRMAELAGMLP